jgi:hypothetical protein
MVKAVLAEVGNVNVWPAIVVVVRNGNAEAPAFIGHAGLFCNIGKGSVVIIVQEHGVRRSFIALQCRER